MRSEPVSILFLILFLILILILILIVLLISGAPSNTLAGIRQGFGG